MRKTMRSAGFITTLTITCGMVAGCSSFETPESRTGPSPAFTAFEAPTRLANRPPAPEPPEPPPGLAEAPPVTVRVVRRAVTTDGQVLEMVQTVSRTAGRIHLADGGGDREWLFHRGETDPRRVTGTLIDHRQGLILDYEENDLRSGGIASSWLDVALLGLPLRVLESMERSGGTERIGDFQATRFIPPASPDAPEDTPDELWWSETDHMPVRVVRRGAASHVVLETSLASRSVDDGLFENPSRRFPAYTRMDLVDWRERH